VSYVIGIDGGGTKTACLIRCLDTANEWRFVLHEGSNPLSVGFKAMHDRLQAAIRQALETYAIPANEVAAVCAGLAGVRLEEDRARAEAELRQVGLALHIPESTAYSVTTDLAVALRGAMHPGDRGGILVIAGTGSNAIGVTAKGEWFRSGGWGHILGDEGSGYAIGLKALQAVCKAYDKRGPQTALTRLVTEALHLKDAQQLISFIYREKPDKDVIAAVAKQVMEAHKQSDGAAMRIMEEAADDLAQHVRSLFDQSGEFTESTSVMTTGSIFEYAPFIKDRFTARLQSEGLGRHRPAYGDAAQGAAALALETLITKT